MLIYLKFTWTMTCKRVILCLFDFKSDSFINDDNLKPAALPE